MSDDEERTRLLPSKQSTLGDTTKALRSLFSHLFLRYGAGAEWFKPVTGWRLFNRVSWIAIILGIIGWGIFVWYLRTHFIDE